MKKTKTLRKQVNHTLQALMMTLVCLLCGNMAAWAEGAGTKEDPYVIDPEVTTYDVVNFNFYGIFTAPTDGDLVINETYAFYTDASFETQDASMNPQFNGNYSNKEYACKVEAGKTYYVGCGFSFNPTVEVRLRTEMEPVELLSISPEQGTVFDAAMGSVDLMFNQKVSMQGCQLTAGNTTRSLNANVRDIYARIDAKDVFAELYANKELKEGDDIKFTFTGVTSVADGSYYNGTGIIEVSYKASSAPLLLVSSTNTPASEVPVNVFKSYYMENDPTGMIMLTFSDRIKEVGSVELSYGDIEGTGEDDAQSQYYVEQLTPNILDNTVVINLKGKTRRPSDMLAGGEKFESMTLKIAGIKDANGNAAYSPGSGTIGSYMFNFTYEIVEYNVIADWTVDGGKITTDTKEIELWLQESNGLKAVFNGVEFNYTENGVKKTATVANKDLTIEVDPEDESASIITIPVPNVNMDANSQVTVSLAGVDSPDGVEHEDYTTTFDCEGRTAAVSNFQIISAIWHGSEGDVNMIDNELGTLPKSSVSTFQTNMSFGYATYSIVDSKGNSLISSYIPESALTITDDVTSFDITWRGAGIKFMEGETYTFTLKAYVTEADSRGGAEPNVGSASFTVTGTEKTYVYSDVTLLNHIANSIVLVDKENNNYTLTFSAPTNLKKAIVNLGMGASQNCNIVANADETEWTVTLPTIVLNEYNEFDLNIFAEDKEGHAIRKAADKEVEGSEDNTWLTITFTCDFNKPEVIVTPANESTLESIETLTFSYSSAISINWSQNEPIIVYNMSTRQEVARITKDDVQYNPNDWDDVNNMYYTFTDPITAVGYYRIEIPSNFFNLGEQFEGGTNKAATIYYEIAQPRESLVIDVNPVGGSVNEVPATIVLTAVGRESANFDHDKSPTLTDQDGNVYEVYFEWGTGWNEVNVVLAAGAITAKNTYTLTIPAGAIYGNDEQDTHTEDIVITYIVTDGVGIDNIIANAGGKVDVYTVNGTCVLRNADVAAVKALRKGLYIINGKKVVIK